MKVGRKETEKRGVMEGEGTEEEEGWQEGKEEGKKKEGR